MNNIFIKRYNEERCRFQISNKNICVLFAVLVFAVIVFTGCTADKTEEITDIPNSEVEELPKELVNVGDDGVNASIAPDDVSVLADQMAKNRENMVAMSVEDMGRSDPFLPAPGMDLIGGSSKLSFDLLPPPEIITVDETAKEVITTKVSGIMYDRYNPSAILNISSSDYLVRTGDVIDNYKVLSITKDVVTVQHGNNIYKAGVGEIFKDDGMNYNTISNLDRKFGGARNSANKR